MGKYNYLYLSILYRLYFITYYYTDENKLIVSTVVKVRVRWKMNSHLKFVTLCVIFKLNCIDFLMTSKSDDIIKGI